MVLTQPLTLISCFAQDSLSLNNLLISVLISIPLSLCSDSVPSSIPVPVQRIIRTFGCQAKETVHPGHGQEPRLLTASPKPVRPVIPGNRQKPSSCDKKQRSRAGESSASLLSIFLLFYKGINRYIQNHTICTRQTRYQIVKGGEWLSDSFILPFIFDSFMKAMYAFSMGYNCQKVKNFSSNLHKVFSVSPAAPDSASRLHKPPLHRIFFRTVGDLPRQLPSERTAGCPPHSSGHRFSY